jgi:dipeptidyl aminopeptidase/acylaminoacyl peptidase
MKKLSILVLLCAICFGAFAQKKVISHKDYDHWKNLRYSQISKDGSLVSYEINPQKGDGNLFILDTKTNKKVKINRAIAARISPESKFLVFKIKAPFDTIRQKTLKKVKKSKMPKDTLGVWIAKDGKILKFKNLKKFILPRDASSFFAYSYTTEKAKKKKDTTQLKNVDKKVLKDSISKEKKADKKEKKKKSVKLKKENLVIFNPISNKKFEYKHVTDYTMSRNGERVLFVQETGDTLKINNLFAFNTKTELLEKLAKGKDLNFKELTISRDGARLAYLQASDTLKTHIYSLVLKESSKSKLNVLVDTLKNTVEGMTASKNGSVYFSKDGKRLFFGIAPKPEQKKKDTLTAAEKYHLDVWNYRDVNIQPYQKLKAKKETKRTYECVYNLKKKNIVQIETKKVKESSTYNNGISSLALTYNGEPYGRLVDSEASFYDINIKNIDTGKETAILKKFKSRASISPAQKYVTYWQVADSCWYSYNIRSKKILNITKSINHELYNVVMDMPMDPSPYGIAGWTKDDKRILIYDQYDMWSVDPAGKKAPKNLTQAYGRKNNITFRRMNLDREKIFVSEKEIILSAFNHDNKKSGYFSVNIKGSTPKMLVFEDMAFNNRAFMKAQKANKIILKKGSFKEYPELYLSDLSLKAAKKISETNPQQKDYNWGSVELVKWTNGDGVEMQGLLYKPENFDATKKYPMLVYFYERSTDALHSHHVPQPNWSIINRSYCVSNGYMIFVPDITYKNKVGFPGEAAYSSIVTGTLAMCDRYKYIDKKNLALQGQSWGGYQIAYLVTRTNLYKCAMAGAPVSNMTSAYGGIRWGSGMSRQFQYEHTQTRLGGTLWDSTIEYLENSPVFFIPKIRTPLLIMHNDADGAVPWYQGIELFMGMRRLNKPVWMLSYNGEAHNLMRRANRKDLSKRTMQFFDFYLKGAKEPVWMKSGVPAHMKNKMTGYELVK